MRNCDLQKVLKKPDLAISRQLFALTNTLIENMSGTP